MFTCPKCHSARYQVKDGLTGAGSQRVRCRVCNHRYTPHPKPHGYSDDLRTQALKLYIDGMNFRRIARHLGVHHQTSINWVNAAANQVPATMPVPEHVETVELDELFTFVGRKKSAATS